MIRDLALPWVKYSVFALFILIIAGCASTTMKAYDTAEEQYRKAFEEYQKHHYIKAVDGFQKVIYNFGGAPMVDSAQFYLAMSYYNQDDFYLAAAEFERLVGTYRGSPFLDDASYMAGLCYFKAAPKNYGLDQEELNKAIDVLSDFVIDYPESDQIDAARATIKDAMERLARKRYENGRMYFRLGYLQSAEIYFQQVIDEHTDTEWAARSLYYLAEIEFRRHNYEAAKDKFNNFLVVYSEHELAEKAREKMAEIEKNIAEHKTENN